MSTSSLLLVAAALVLSIIWLVNAPAAGAASDAILVEPVEFSVSEPDAHDTLTSTLAIEPNDPISITLAASDATECHVEPPSLELAKLYWEMGATAMVSAMDGFAIDGPTTCTIVTSPATSADVDFAGEDPDDVAVIVAENDEAGFILDPTSLVVAEPDGTATFTLALTSQPTDTVSIDVGAENSQECAVTPDKLLLTPENWQIGVTATVIALDDDVIDGPQSCLVELGRAKSLDENYDSLNPPDVSVLVLDDDGVQDASIGDLVWLDEDGDGVQDAAESGLADVVVFLDFTGDGLLDAGEPYTVTDEYGSYAIIDLGAGSYSVRVDADTVPTGYALTTGNTPLAVDLAESEQYDQADFGYDDDSESASIGDYVWVDQDGDGVQDSSEMGLPDVVVFLDLDDSGALDEGEPSATTDANGNYAIVGLAAGVYTVTVDAGTVPAGYVLSTGNIPLTVDLTESEQYDEADFGYDDNPDDGSIGDYVWVDQDGDGVQDDTEPGLPDVVVYLDLDGSGTPDGGEPSAATDAYGAYDLTGLAAGFYTVTVDADTVPAGYGLTTENVPLEVPLEAGQYYYQADFGYDDDPADASIGDYVWLDENGDGIQDETEPGLAGITVYLDLDGSGTPDGGEPSSTSDEGGTYAIAGLAAGVYTVTVDADTVPAGYVLTTDPLPLIVDLAVSETNVDADFGYDDDPEDASIGDYVWVDQDGDGVQDGTEPGLSDIVVYLDLNENGALDDEPSATTNASGNYEIIDLSAGYYLVRVDAATIPAGYALTTGNLPLDVNLGVSEDYNDADFGYDDDPSDASVGDYVWFDQDGDGVQDEAESGLSGITVYLDLDDSGTLDEGEPSATSDEGGNYTIAGLAAGFYTVTVDADTVPADYVSTTSNIPMTVELVAGEHYIDADFGYEGYTLALELVGEGSVLIDPEWTTYRYGDEITLTAIPDAGWRFDSWSGDLEGTTNPAVVLMDGDKTVSANFELQSYTYVYLPLVLNRWPPVPSVPVLDSIDNTDGDGSYTVSWSASSSAETYMLQEATNSAFVDAAIIYTGPATSHDLSGRGAARYHYRVKALNAWGESEWSNVRQADVVWEAEPNDVYTQANGAIVPTLVYYGTLPNAADVQDYYFFELSVARRAGFWLTNIPAGQDYDLVLRDESLSVVGYAPQDGNSNEHVEADLSPGRYYIQIYHRSTGGSTQPYNVWFVLE